MRKLSVILVIAFVLVAIIILVFSFYHKEEEDTINYLSYFTEDSTVSEVIHNASFEGFGELIFPIDLDIPLNTPLNNLENYYVWYHYMNTDKTVEIVNYMKEQVEEGDRIFYSIYTEEEMREDPDKRNTGLFFFRGNPNSKFAIVNAGGGFMYVAAMQDSFPQALEISKKGYNAFALIYRPDADLAMEDLARAVAFIHENASELQVDVTDYSVWGGSAGARMAAWLGGYGTESFGEKAYPRPAAVIMQYTGLSEVTGMEPPTYNCVGTNDGIAPYQIMEARIERIKQNGTDAEIEIFEGLPHGFGLGLGTNAEGWIEHAISFWERQM